MQFGELFTGFLVPQPHAGNFTGIHGSVIVVRYWRRLVALDDAFSGRPSMIVYAAPPLGQSRACEGFDRKLERSNSKLSSRANDK